MALPDGGGVELVEAFAHGAGGAHHDGVGELARIVIEHALRFEIGGGDGQRGGEADLEFGEGGAAQRAAEAGDGRLAHLGPGREFGNGHAGRHLVVRGHDVGDAALGRRQVWHRPAASRETMSIAAGLRARPCRQLAALTSFTSRVARVSALMPETKLHGFARRATASVSRRNCASSQPRNRSSRKCHIPYAFSAGVALRRCRQQMPIARSEFCNIISRSGHSCRALRA